MGTFIRYMSEHPPATIALIGIFMAVVMVFIPAESEPYRQFTVTEFRDSYGRACTVVEGGTGWGNQSVSIDCGVEK